MNADLPTAADAMVGVLRENGVRAVFGNPGTTELPLMKALAQDGSIEYYLGLHEDICTGMAAGYAAVSGAAGVAILHSVPGVAHGLGNYYDAYRNGLPVVLFAGQPDVRHQFLTPMLYGDLVHLIEPFSKFAWEARTSLELSAVVRRALTEAVAAPSGPTFVSIPLDVQFGPFEASEPLNAAPIRLGAAHAGAVRAVADAFVNAERPAIVAGDLLGRAQCQDEVAELARVTASAGYWEPLSFFCNFPKTSPEFQGVLFPSGADFRRPFEQHDFVLWCGSDLRSPLLYDGTEWSSPACDVAVLSDTASGAAAGLRARHFLIGDPTLTLRALIAEIGNRMPPATAARGLELTQASQQAAVKIQNAAAKRKDALPLSPLALIDRVLRELPLDAIVVDDAVSNSGWVALCGNYRNAADYLGPSKGGGIGFGLPAALGAQVAAPERPVIAFLGDGAAMYSIVGLWTAAKYGLPVVFVILNNTSYRILKAGAASMFSGLAPAQLAAIPGLDLDGPAPDFVGCARGLGIDAVRVETLDDALAAIRRGFESRRPLLVDVAVERDVRPVLK